MRDIVVYVDQGVSGEALRQTVKCLQHEVDLNRHALKRKNAKQLTTGGWEKETALLVIPGGRDVYYHSALDGKGTERIRRYVEEGGGYLGICAGAYFAADIIEFEKGAHLQVCGSRSLKFYPGRAIGPTYGHGRYSYEDQHIEAAPISWNHEEGFTYFNGGCYFDSAQQFPNVRVLSQYLNVEDKPAAIVECTVGKGKALLSGVHVEFSTRFLMRDGHRLERVFPQLEQSEKLRRVIFREILKRFNIQRSLI